MNSKRYTVPFARLREWAHPNPKRTAFRPMPGLNFDCECMVFNNRAFMLEACRKSDTGELGHRRWKPLIEKE